MSDAIKIIKYELANIDSDTPTNMKRMILLSKAMSVAVTALQEISIESSTTESSRDDLVKLENRVTKKAHFALKTIANILSGVKDGK